MKTRTVRIKLDIEIEYQSDIYNALRSINYVMDAVERLVMQENSHKITLRERDEVTRYQIPPIAVVNVQFVEEEQS